MDNNMHDLKLERFYKVGQTVNDSVALPDGPIKTFTLRGIKDSPPYLHDGRLMTLADTVEFFNLVLGTKLTPGGEGCARRLHACALRSAAGARRAARSVILAAAWLAVLPMSAAAQMGNPGFMAPDTRTDESGMPATDQTNSADMLFVQLVAEGGLAEVSLGELASEKAAALRGQGVRGEDGRGSRRSERRARRNRRGARTSRCRQSSTPSTRRCASNLDGMDAAAFDLELHARPGRRSPEDRAAAGVGDQLRTERARCNASPPRTLPAVLEHLAMARGIVEEFSREQLAAAPPEPRSE